MEYDWKDGRGQQAAGQKEYLETLVKRRDVVGAVAPETINPRGLPSKNTSGGNTEVERTVREEAEAALGQTYNLHEHLDDLEERLFSQPLRDVNVGNAQTINAVAPRMPLSETVSATRQRLDSATERLSRLISRL